MKAHLAATIVLGIGAVLAANGTAVADPTTLVCDNPGGSPLVVTVNEAQGLMTVSSGSGPAQIGYATFTPDTVTASMADGGVLLNDYAISRVALTLSVTQISTPDNTIAERFTLQCRLGAAQF